MIKDNNNGVKPRMIFLPTLSDRIPHMISEAVKPTAKIEDNVPHSTTENPRSRKYKGSMGPRIPLDNP